MPPRTPQLIIDDPRVEIPITECSTETHVFHYNIAGGKVPGMHIDESVPTYLDYHAIIVKTDQWTYATIERTLRRLGQTERLFCILIPGEEAMSFTGYVEEQKIESIRIRATTRIVNAIPIDYGVPLNEQE